MTGIALGLVLIAASLHASWNLLAKRVTGDVVAFVWLCSALSAVIYGPIVVVAILLGWVQLRLDAIALGMIGGTGLIHIAYFMLLQHGYRAGDMSLVYPLARGTGPLLASIAAIVWLGERPGPWGIAGIAGIVAGAFLASGGSWNVRLARASVLYGAGTGATIAAYTLWDKIAVTTFAISPLPYDLGRHLVQVALMAPAAIRRRAGLAEVWRTARFESLGIAVLSPLAYVLVLFALRIAPVSLVAPAREVSIVIGTILGARLFAEGQIVRRTVAACLMFAGIVALAHG